MTASINQISQANIPNAMGAGQQVSFDQREAERTAELVRSANEKIERQRVQQNNIWQRRMDSNSVDWRSQPYQYGKPIGKQAYKWFQNVKLNDGNFYAMYHHVRGGANYIYYSLSDQTWKDIYTSPVRCNNCHSNYQAVYNAKNVCPSCSYEQSVGVII